MKSVERQLPRRTRGCGLNPDRRPVGAWSPDGTRLAFGSYRDGNSEIYVMNVDGTNLVRLTNDAGMDRFPAWSPDGSRVAFTSNRDGNDEIYVMSAEGTGLSRLTNHLAIDFLDGWRR